MHTGIFRELRQILSEKLQVLSLNQKYIGSLCVHVFVNHSYIVFITFQTILTQFY